MKKLIIAGALVLAPWFSFAADQVHIPWEEFKTLYKESIEKKLLENQETEPFVYSINQALYHISLSPRGGSGRLVIQGKYISGKPDPIPLFTESIIIKDLVGITGGSLACSREKEDGIAFFPDKKGQFRIELSVYLPMREDAHSRFLQLRIPKALKNSLTLDLSKELILLEAPGIKDQTGQYIFPAQTDLTLRVADKKQKGIKSRIEKFSSHFEPVDIPPVVLDSVFWFTSFEETGNVLSVLVMDLPEDAGNYLAIDVLPESRIWSMKVNGNTKKIYRTAEKEDKWLIPLSKGAPSHVELAIIRQGSKLGLQGRLETALPGMGLAARQVNLAIALPKRVTLTSFEGPLNSDAKANVRPPKEFVGKPYFFSRSFYKGQGMNIAVMYKEPAKKTEIPFK